jgi:hypothetical protein
MRKRNQPKGLLQQNVLIDDNQFDSRYFEVADMPTRFTGGKNLFKLRGNKEFLKPGSSIEVEVTDSTGNVIYHELIDYLEPNTSQRVVSVYVYSDTPGGMATVTIAGTATRRPNGSPVPAAFRDAINVKWSRRVVCRPNIQNDTEVILLQSPRTTIQEKIKNYIVPSGGLATVEYNLSGTNMSYQYESFLGRGGAAQGQGRITSTTSFFSASMVGGEIEFTSAIPDINANQTLQQRSSVGQYSTISNITYRPIIIDVISETQAIVQPAIEGIVKTAITPPRTIDLNSGGTLISFDDIQFDSFPATRFTCSFQDFNVPFITQSVNTVSFAKVSFANMEPETGQIRKLRTSIKSQGIQTFTVMAEQDLAARELLTHDDAIGVQEDLGFFVTQSIIDGYWRADKSRLNTIASVIHGGTSDLAAVQSIAAGNASASTVGSQAIGMSLNNGVMMNSMKIQLPTNANTGFFNTYQSATNPLHTRVTFNTSQDMDDDGQTTFGGYSDGGVYVFQGNTYRVTLELALGADPLLPAVFPRAQFAISGSAIKSEDTYNDDIKKYELVLDDIQLTVQPANPIIQTPVVGQGNSQLFSQPLGTETENQLVPFSQAQPQQIANQQNTLNYNTYIYEFVPVSDGYIQFVVKSMGGIVYVRNISVKSIDMAGFTPNHTYTQFEVPTFQADDVLDFKFELLDNLNNVVYTGVTQSMAFVGSNTFMSGVNQLAGTLMIGEGILVEGIVAE